MEPIRFDPECGGKAAMTVARVGNFSLAHCIVTNVPDQNSFAYPIEFGVERQVIAGEEQLLLLGVLQAPDFTSTNEYRRYKNSLRDGNVTDLAAKIITSCIELKNDNTNTVLIRDIRWNWRKMIAGSIARSHNIMDHSKLVTVAAVHYESSTANKRSSRVSQPLQIAWDALADARLVS